MFKQLFASMNDALDDIVEQLPLADPTKRKDLNEQISVLKAMSDTCIEEWLLFEEKLGQLLNTVHDHAPAASTPQHQTGKKTMPVIEPAVESSFFKAQGYYKLGMFPEAVTEFEHVVKGQPDDLLARMYLAMAYLRNGDYKEAYRHFQFLIPLTDNRKMKAISYNAMGCIHVENRNFDQAMEYFRKAHSADPSSMESILPVEEWPTRH